MKPIRRIKSIVIFTILVLLSSFIPALTIWLGYSGYINIALVRPIIIVSVAVIGILSGFIIYSDFLEKF